MRKLTRKEEAAGKKSGKPSRMWVGECGPLTLTQRGDLEVTSWELKC